MAKKPTREHMLEAGWLPWPDWAAGNDPKYADRFEFCEVDWKLYARCKDGE